MPAAELRSTIDVRPEATILTLSHAAFTVRQIMFAPIDEPRSSSCSTSTRAAPDHHRLVPAGAAADVARRRCRRRMPAGTTRRTSTISEESGRFAGDHRLPGGAIASVMPYQEEPRDVPLEFADRRHARAGRTRVHADRDRGGHRRAARQRAPPYEPRPRDDPCALRPDGADTYANCSIRTLARHHAGRAAHSRVRLGARRHGQGPGHEPAARHRARRRVPHVGRQRAAGIRLVLRPRRALDGAGAHRRRRRLEHRAHGARLPAKYQREDGKIPHEISQSAGARAVVHRLSVPVGERRRDAALRDRARRLLAGRRRSRVPRAPLAVDPEGLPVLRRHRHRRQRPDREHRRRPRLGGRRRALPAARGDLPAGAVDRGVAQLRRDGQRDGRPQPPPTARAAAERTRAAVEKTYWLPGPSHYAFATAQARTDDTGGGARPGARTAAAPTRGAGRSRSQTEGARL